MSKVAAGAVFILTVTWFLALVHCGAVASTCIQLQDHDHSPQDTGRKMDWIRYGATTMGNSVYYDSLYKRISFPAQSYNGPGFRHSFPSLKGTPRRLMVMSKEEKKKKVGGAVIKQEENRPSSGIQIKTPLRSNTVVSRDQIYGLGLPEEDGTWRRLGVAVAHQHSPVEQGSAFPPNGKRGTLLVSDSSRYRPDEADLSDITGMDYGRARRKPPIHNRSSP